MTRNLPEIQCGKIKRKTFSKIKEAIEIPYLVEIQKDSYDSFIREGISEVFEDFSPITDYSDHFELYFLDHSLEGTPKYGEKECRERDATFALPLRVKVRLVNKVTDEVIDQEVFMGDLPLMTDNGSFIINGAEPLRKVSPEEAQALRQKLGIADGAVVYVNHDPVQSGDVGIFCVDGDMLCKQYYRDPLGSVYLFSLNRRRSDADQVFTAGSGRSLTCFGRVMLRTLPLPL